MIHKNNENNQNTQPVKNSKASLVIDSWVSNPAFKILATFLFSNHQSERIFDFPFYNNMGLY